MQKSLAEKQYLVPRSQTVEVPIDAVNSGQFKFPDSTTLRGKTIVGMAIRPQNSSGTRKSQRGRDLIPNDALACAFLNLRYNNVNVIETLPAELLTPEFLSQPYFQLCIPRGYDPQESFVEFSDISTITAGQSIEIVFYYYDDYCLTGGSC